MVRYARGLCPLMSGTASPHVTLYGNYRTRWTTRCCFHPEHAVLDAESMWRQLENPMMSEGLFAAQPIGLHGIGTMIRLFIV